MMRVPLLMALLLLTALSSAQPYKFGCHYFRNAHPCRPEAMTDGERESLQDLIARSDTFDILHYDIAVDVTNYSGKSISAAVTIAYRVKLASPVIRFNLIDTLTVDSVIMNGQPLSFSHSSDLLTVVLPGAVPGDDYALTVHYHGHPARDPQWGGFYFESNYIYSLGIGLSTVPPYFGKVWYPCFDSFVERASYTWHIKSAGSFRAHGQGELVDEVQLGGDTVIRTFDFAPSIPTHIASIAVADYKDSTFIHSGAYGDVPVTLTAKPSALNAMVGKFASIGDAIDCDEFWYGPYPYSRVGYVFTTDGAMEIPTNVAYPDFMNSQSLLENRGLFGHELGHHWWGDKLTPRTHNDMWLKEGPAEYSAHLLEEWIGGENAFVKVVKDNQLNVLENAHLDDGGFQPLSPMPDPYVYGTHTYYKGASVMHNLRGYLGDTLFRQALHTVQQLYQDTTLDAAGFRDALSAASGQDLHAFFDAQVFSPGFAVFVVRDMNAQQNGNVWDVQLQLQQRLRGTTSYHEQVPLDLTLLGAGWQKQEFHIMAGGDLTDVQVQCDFEPVMAVLNRYNRLNQARMDHEQIIHPNVSFPSTLPRVEFRLFQSNLSDSALVRIEHLWAAPDNDNLGWGVYGVSDSHYWSVDGLWPDTAELNARVYYHAADNTDLDFGLYGGTEADAMLVYRAKGTDPWELYPDFTLVANSLTDGQGYMKIDVLRKGQYAFANGNVVAGIHASAGTLIPLSVSPNPSSSMVRVSGSTNATGTLLFDVLDTDGRLVERSSLTATASFSKELDVSSFPPGAYSVRVRSAAGDLIGAARFQVSH